MPFTFWQIKKKTTQNFD